MGTLKSELIVAIADQASKPAAQIGEAMKKVESQIKAIDGAMRNSGASAGFQRQLASLGRSAADIDSVAAAWKKYAASVGAAENASSWTKSQTGQIRAWEQATIRSLRNVESQEKSFQRSQQQLQNARVRNAERAGERAGVGHMLRNGVIAYTGAHAVLHTGKSALEQGAELQHERAALVAAHQPSPEEMKEVDEATRASAKAIPTTTVAENVKVLNETVGAFGSLKEAIENLQFNQKTAAFVSAATGGKVSSDAGEVGYEMGKYGEMRRITQSPERYQDEMSKMAQAMVFTGGKFNPHELFEMGTMSKGSLAPLDEHFATRILPSIAAERMGAPTGTALNAWENVISGKARDAKQAKMWMDLGLLDPKKVDLNSHGAPISWQAGAVRNTGLAQRDPLAWTEKEMLPALQKHGYDINDPEKLQQALNTLFRNSNANLFAADLSDPKSRLRLHKDERLMDEVMTPDRGYKYMLENDPTQGLKSITAALQDLGQAVTGPGMQQIGSVLSSISGGVKSFAQVLQDHPHLATAGGITAASAGIGGAGWFASQMAGGFGLSKSATELDGAAAALTRAAGALGGGKAGELAADAAGAGSAAKPSRLRRFGRLAGRTLKALPVAGLVADAADTLRDIEVAHGAGQQPGAVNEGYDSILGSPRRVPFVPEKPKEYDAFRDALEAHQRDSQPGWTVNQPQKAFPMTGAGGATAGVEGPEFPNVTGLNGASGVADALNIGSQTQAAGAASGAGYLEGLRSQLDAAASYAEEIAQRIRNALDFSVSPSIGSSSSSTPNPGRQSSLIHTDHGRASAAGGAGWSLG